MSQTAEGITSVTPILEIAKANGIVMPIVQQVHMVLEGELSPKNLGPHLATEDGIPKRELVLGSAQPSRWRRLFGRRKDSSV